MKALVWVIRFSVAVIVTGCFAIGARAVVIQCRCAPVLRTGEVIADNETNTAFSNVVAAAWPLAVAAPHAAPQSRSKPRCSPPRLQNLRSIRRKKSLGEGGKNMLAVFEVDGDRLVGVSYRDKNVAEGALALWREIVLRIPKNQRLDLVQFQIFDGKGTAGYVDNNGTGNQTGRYGCTLSLNKSNLESNPADPCAPLSRRRGNFDWTMIHEFAHLRGYADGSINKFTRDFPGQTGPGEGYPEDGSPRLDGDWVSSYAERAGGDEDFAESFTAYVMLDELPAGDSVAANKVRWFDAIPGYSELRRRLRITESDGSKESVPPAPRRDFPLVVEPAEWMVGKWRGTAEKGKRVEYHITPKDIVRIRFENNREVERLRYRKFRDGGVLAIVDLYSKSDSFYLHQVSVAGSSFSESFRRKDERIFVESERLGDFFVDRIKR